MIETRFGTYMTDGIPFQEAKDPAFENLKIWMNPASLTGDASVLTWPSRGYVEGHLYNKIGSPQFRPGNNQKQNEVYFPGLNGNYLSCNDLTSYNFLHDGSPFSIYVVSKLDPLAAGTNWIMGNANNPTLQIGFEFWEHLPSPTQWRVNFHRLRAAGVNTRLTELAMIVTTPPLERKVYCITHSGGVCRGYFGNSVVRATANDNGTPNLSNPTGLCSIGNVGSFGAYYHGAISEIMIFDEAHDAIRIDNTMDYLKIKHRI